MSFATIERVTAVHCSLHSFQRVDGRQCEEYRRVKLFVGSEPGSCLATFGNTKLVPLIDRCLVLE